MSETDAIAGTLRIYADFNSGGVGGVACWCLRHGEAATPLDDCAAALHLHAGQVVTLYYSDPAEEFEVSARLEYHADRPHWRAMPDWSSLRRLRG